VYFYQRGHLVTLAQRKDLLTRALLSEKTVANLESKSLSFERLLIPVTAWTPPNRDTMPSTLGRYPFDAFFLVRNWFGIQCSRQSV
jgi:hypothetical protein